MVVMIVMIIMMIENEPQDWQVMSFTLFLRFAYVAMTIDQIIKQGLFNGARLDTKAIEAAKQAEN